MEVRCPWYALEQTGAKHPSNTSTSEVTTANDGAYLYIVGHKGQNILNDRQNKNDLLDNYYKACL